LSRKRISVWVFITLTFVALIHLVEAISAMVLDSQIKLLQPYPLINEQLLDITPTAYFWISAFTSLILWRITCTIAFENPVETFLNKKPSDA
jgi:hypothetical protein